MAKQASKDNGTNLGLGFEAKRLATAAAPRNLVSDCDRTSDKPDSQSCTPAYDTRVRGVIESTVLIQRFIQTGAGTQKPRVRVTRELEVV